MVKHLRNFITEDVKDHLLGKYTRNARYYDFTSDPIIYNIAKAYQKKVDKGIKLHKPSYWRVENRIKGHDWHYDGCKDVKGKLVDNHMPWCRYGTTVLLSDPEKIKGGELSYKDGDKEITIPHRLHYRSAMVYTGGKDNDPVLHKVTPHSGRFVLLMFFGTN